MTDAEVMFRVHNPYRNGIDSVGLSFAHRTMREVREALEHGAQFRGAVGKEELAAILRECAEIKKLLKARGMA